MGSYIASKPRATKRAIPGTCSTPAGLPLAFGCWKRGLKETWCERTNTLSQAEWNDVRRRWCEAEAHRERVETERRTTARKTAKWIFARAKPVTTHAYLATKGVKVFGDMREWRGALVIPLRDSSGELHSLQFIGVDGSKKFLTGGRVAGCFFTLADRPDGPLIVCEGYATSASVYEATSHATVAAMNCGNLKATAEALRRKWPDRQLVIAADNDAWTDGNPGLSKATEAAKAIGAKLAVPQFAGVTSQPTDFNDLHQLQGLDAVKDQIQAAEPPKETDAEAFDRLAKLSPADYDRCRKAEAERLGIRPQTLDDEVAARRPKAKDDKAQGAAVVLPDVDPWPDPVSGAEVLNEVALTFARYVVLPPGAADALALWCAHAHAFEAFAHTPRLNFCSPDKGCGKTLCLDVASTLVPQPLRTESITSAVLFRLVQLHQPTLLLDEVDAYLNDSDDVRGLLNAGYRRGGKAVRCEGDNHQLRAFSAFAPAALAGIGHLPGTLHDRSIVVKLVRAKPGEVLARFDSRHVIAETELSRKLARWTKDNFARLKGCDPKLPANAFNRLADNWRPLLAVAEVAGEDWPRRAIEAFANLTNSEDVDGQGIGAMLLADIRIAFSEASATRMFSKELVQSLCRMSDRPWPEAHHGKPISETWLARRLKSFGVAPHTLRVGEERAKGYELADLAEAFTRFLPETPVSRRDSVTTLANTGGKPLPEGVTTEGLVTAPNAHETVVNTELSRCHGSKTPDGEETPAEALLL